MVFNLRVNSILRTDLIFLNKIICHFHEVNSHACISVRMESLEIFTTESGNTLNYLVYPNKLQNISIVQSKK